MMKRWIIILFLIVAVVAAQTACAEDRNGFLKGVGDWFSDAAGDVAEWTTDAASDAWDWTTDAAADGCFPRQRTPQISSGSLCLWQKRERVL